MAADEALDRAVAEHQRGRTRAHARRPAGSHHSCQHERHALLLERCDPAGEILADQPVSSSSSVTDPTLASDSFTPIFSVKTTNGELDGNSTRG